MAIKHMDYLIKKWSLQVKSETLGYLKLDCVRYRLNDNRIVDESVVSRRILECDSQHLLRLANSAKVDGSRPYQITENATQTQHSISILEGPRQGLISRIKAKTGDKPSQLKFKKYDAAFSITLYTRDTNPDWVKYGILVSTYCMQADVKQVEQIYKSALESDTKHVLMLQTTESRQPTS
jgi:hypothetical protein